MFTVYKIKNKLEDKCYIGVTTKTLKERFMNHVYDRNKNTDRIPLRKALCLYKIEDFEIEELEKCDSKQKTNEREKHYIKYFNSIKKGYNIATGGVGGDTLTHNLHRDKISEKLRVSKIGSRNHNAKAVIVCVDDKIFKTFGSAGEATRFFIKEGIKIAESSVKRKCNKIIKNNSIGKYKVYWGE